MTDIAIERRTLVNALRHAAEIYAAAATSPTRLQKLALALKAERADLAERLAADWEIEPVAGLATAADIDDVARRIASSEEALAQVVDREERGIEELLEDMSGEAIDDALRSSLTASTAGARRAVLDEVLTLKASVERVPPADRSFTFEGLETSEPAERKPAARICQLWYGTNRQPVMRAGKLIGFSNDRSDVTQFGQCDVTIPEAHKIGEIGSRWWQRIGRGDDRLLLNAIREQGEDAFWDSVRLRIKETAAPGDAIVLVHGYRVSFEDAAIRAAQIGADLALGGAMAFFSWPSRGRFLSYTVDEASIEASEAQITQFLVDFADKSGARAVHVIAHSMGNRGLLRAVQRISATAAARSAKPFGQIILAAPDVDATIFRGLATAYPIVAARTTLYVSEADLAVRSSRLLHGADRIGFAPPVAIVAGIDTINVTGVDLSLLGHGYVGECRSVLTDMRELLARGTEPMGRAMLREVIDAAGARHWEIAA